VKLDRNENDNGRGKYALILLREIQMADGSFPPGVQQALDTLKRVGVLDWGAAGSDSEFFLIRLKDRHAATALYAYARSAEEFGEVEWAKEVRALANTAATHPGKKQPD